MAPETPADRLPKLEQPAREKEDKMPKRTPSPPPPTRPPGRPTKKETS